MKTAVFIFILIIYLQSCMSKSQPIEATLNFADNSPLIGNVNNYRNTQSCKIESYTLFKETSGFKGELSKTEILDLENGRIKEQNTFDSSGSFESRLIYIYDPEYRLIEIQKSTDTLNIDEHIFYKTDPQGNILEEKHQVGSDNFFREEWCYTYDFHNDNQVTALINNVPNFYSANIQLTKTMLFNDHFDLINSSIKSYYDSLIVNCQYTYDANNMLTKKEEYDKDDRIKSVAHYKYDKQNRIAEITRFEFNHSSLQDSVLTKTFYAYTDKNT